MRRATEGATTSRDSRCRIGTEGLGSRIERTMRWGMEGSGDGVRREEMAWLGRVADVAEVEVVGVWEK